MMSSMQWGRKSGRRGRIKVEYEGAQAGTLENSRILEEGEEPENVCLERQEEKFKKHEPRGAKGGEEACAGRQWALFPVERKATTETTTAAICHSIQRIAAVSSEPLHMLLTAAPLQVKKLRLGKSSDLCKSMNIARAEAGTRTCGSLTPKRRHWVILRRPLKRDH